MRDYRIFEWPDRNNTTERNARCEIGVKRKRRKTAKDFCFGALGINGCWSSDHRPQIAREMNREQIRKVLSIRRRSAGHNHGS